MQGESEIHRKWGGEWDIGWALHSPRDKLNWLTRGLLWKKKCPWGHAANGLGSNLVTDVAAMKTLNDTMH